MFVRVIYCVVLVCHSSSVEARRELVMRQCGASSITKKIFCLMKLFNRSDFENDLIKKLNAKILLNIIVKTFKKADDVSALL